MITTRTARHRRITELLAAGDVRSQAELAERLAVEGISVTQATLSRDLLEIGAVKVRNDSGSFYALPGDGSADLPRSADATSRLRRVCTDLLVEATVSENLVVLRTPPAGANLLASAIDHARPTNIVGTIAGDDTVLVIAASAGAGKKVAELLVGLAGSENSDSETAGSRNTSGENAGGESTGMADEKEQQ